MTPLDLLIFMLALAGGLFVNGIVFALCAAMFLGATRGVKKNAPDTQRIL